MHICVSKLTTIGSDNGLSPSRRQAIIWTNAGILLIGPWGTNFSEISIQILTFSLKKMRLNVSSEKRRPFCLGLNVLRYIIIILSIHKCHTQIKSSWNVEHVNHLNLMSKFHCYYLLAGFECWASLLPRWPQWCFWYRSIIGYDLCSRLVFAGQGSHRTIWISSEFYCTLPYQFQDFALCGFFSYSYHSCFIKIWWEMS